MARGPVYRFQRGEPIVIGREVLSGDPSVYTVEAVLKETTGQVVPAAITPPAATFDVTFVAADGNAPARWLLSIAAAITADLDPGHYVTDVRFIVAGDVVSVSDPAFITISESVSG